VMSYRAWQQHYGGDSAVIGAAFTMNTVQFTVAGIVPPGFFGDQLRPDPPDFWLPLSTEPALNGNGAILNHPDTDWLYIVGRLKPAVNPARVQSEVTAQLQHWLSIQPNVRARDRAQLSRQHIVITPAGRG